MAKIYDSVVKISDELYTGTRTSIVKEKIDIIELMKEKTRLLVGIDIANKRLSEIEDILDDIKSSVKKDVQ